MCKNKSWHEKRYLFHLCSLKPKTKKKNPKQQQKTKITAYKEKLSIASMTTLQVWYHLIYFHWSTYLYLSWRIVSINKACIVSINNSSSIWCRRKYWPPTLFRDSTACIVGTPGSRDHYRDVFKGCYVLMRIKKTWR